MYVRSVVVVLLLAVPAGAAAPPARLTEKQEELLRQRDRHLRAMKARMQDEDLPGLKKQFELALKAQQEVYGTDNVGVANMLGQKAKFHQGKEATRLLKQKADVLGRLYGRSHWRAVDARLELNEEKLTLDEDQREEMHQAAMRQMQGTMLYNQGRYKEALTLMRQATSTYRDLLGAKSPVLVTAHGNVGRILQGMGEAEKAIVPLTKSMTLAKEVFGEEHPEYGITLKNLAIAHSDLGQHARALKLFTQAGRVFRAVLGEDTPEEAEILDSLARTYKEMGEFDKALPLARRAVGLTRVLERGKKFGGKPLDLMEMIAQSFGPNPPDKRRLGSEGIPTLPTYVGNLALLHADRGEYRLAEPLYQESLQLQRKFGLSKQHGYASTLNNLGRLHQFRGESRKAVKLYESALELLARTVTKKHPHYVMSLGNLAAVLVEMGDLNEALRVNREALRLADQTGGEDHPFYPDLLTSAGTIHVHLGNPREAVRAYERALRLLDEKKLDKVESAVGVRVSLGSVYATLGDGSRTAHYLEEALRLTRKHYGEDHPRYAALLNTLAGIYANQGEHAAALRLAVQGYEILRAGDLDGEKLLRPLHTLSILNYRLGRHERALALAERGRASAVALDSKSQTATSLLFSAGLLNLERGKRGAGLVFMAQATALERDRLEAVTGILSERERQAAVAESAIHFQQFLSFAQDALPPAALYDWVLSYKDAESLAAAQRRLARSDEKLKPLFEELIDARAGLARLAGQPTSAGWSKQFDLLDRRKNELQERLSAASAEGAGLFARPTWRRVAAALPPRSALVEFIVYEHSQRQDPRTLRNPSDRRLLAFILRPGRDPVVVSLGAFRPIDSALTRWRASVVDRDSLSPNAGVAEQLRRLLWAPVDRHLDGVETVLIAPDAALSSLPFAALPGSKTGTFLIEDYAIGYLTSGRQLLQPAPRRRGTGLLTVGGVDYGAKGRSGWGRLPGTKFEADKVESAFRRAFSKVPTESLSGEEAGRDQLAALLGRKKGPWASIHLGTHGQFSRPRDAVPPAAVAVWAAGMGAQRGLAGPAGVMTAALAADQPGYDLLGRGDRVAGDNPMLLCGLVMAGANQYGAGAVLTAEEIASLDLDGTDLVVLSACETGLGVQAGWQGVQGFQQAFHQAGVATVVSSLWNVSDPATSVLMEEFYEQLWVKKKSPLAAMRVAQLAVLKDPDRVRKRAKELKAMLSDRGVSDSELEDRGIQPKARKVERPLAKGERSPVAWWAAFVLSGRP